MKVINKCLRWYRQRLIDVRDDLNLGIPQPVKVEDHETNRDKLVYSCPNCKVKLVSTYRRWCVCNREPNCPACGQNLNWR